MKFIKTKHLLTILSILFLQVSIVSCSKDNNNKNEPVPLKKPTIEDLEIGYQNTKKAYTESDLHLEAHIFAEAKIKSVRVQITPKVSGNSWFVDITYTKGFEGNTEGILHQHYDIPKNAKEGMYDVLIIVIDTQGNKTIAEDVLTIEKDPSLPTVSQKSATFNNNVLNVKANISAPNKLESITIKVKDIEKKYQETELVGKTTYLLDKDIDVSSLNNGHYHFFVTITDQSKKVFSYEGHFDKK